MILFQQCHEYHQQNQVLAQEIEELKAENDFLSKDCQNLENQTEQQIRYINCVKQLNQKTEETLQKLQIYQEELKQLLHKGKNDNNPKFDPIQFIKSVTSAQQEEIELPNEFLEEQQNKSFVQELSPLQQINQEDKSFKLNYKVIGLITATLITAFVVKKKLL